MSLLLGLLFSPSVIVFGIVTFIVFYITRTHKSRSQFSKLPQPSGKLPLLGHTLLLVKKGVNIHESSFQAFYDLAVQFHDYGLYAFGLAIQPTVHIFSPEHFEKVHRSFTHQNKFKLNSKTYR